ncbi:hypothetical protein CGZ95_20540 [Enemella evansiae]|nr:hypothetical protein CGZ95_20540 [Enemella evansiae]
MLPMNEQNGWPVYPGPEPEEPTEEPDLIPNLEPEPEVEEIVEPPRRRPMAIGLWALFHLLAVLLMTWALLLDSESALILTLTSIALMVLAGGSLVALWVPRLRFWEAADVLFTRNGGERFGARPARYAVALTILTSLALAFGIAGSTGIPTAATPGFPQSLLCFAFAVPGIIYARYMIRRHLRLTPPSRQDGD